MSLYSQLENCRQEPVTQATLDRDLDILPPWFENFKDDLSVKFALVYHEDRLLIHRSLTGWVLQIIHVDHAGESKVKEIAETVFQPNKDNDIEKSLSLHQLFQVWSEP